ncbi:hypothetical protein DMENIID0001_153710 [Sergentomyia squamirostris]
MNYFLLITYLNLITWRFADSEFKCPNPPEIGRIYFPNPINCTTYYDCTKTVPTLIPCADGTAFDDARLTCDRRIYTKCLDSLSKNKNDSKESKKEVENETIEQENPQNQETNNQEQTTAEPSLNQVGTENSEGTKIQEEELENIEEAGSNNELNKEENDAQQASSEAPQPQTQPIKSAPKKIPWDDYQDIPQPTQSREAQNNYLSTIFKAPFDLIQSVFGNDSS